MPGHILLVHSVLLSGPMLGPRDMVLSGVCEGLSEDPDSVGKLGEGRQGDGVSESHPGDGSCRRRGAATTGLEWVALSILTLRSLVWVQGQGGGGCPRRGPAHLAEELSLAPGGDRSPGVGVGVEQARGLDALVPGCARRVG